MRISVVTPSFKQPDWLRLCAASVSDQAAPGLEVEHIVHDSLSGPEIAEALKPFPAVTLVSEKDEGMYDAINRGWKKATGDVYSWLNCDEQYLPGTLQLVAAYFEAHPEVDVLFADVIITDGDGNYTCSRQVLLPELNHTLTSHLQTFSCSTFFRSGLLKKRDFWLDSKWKDLGDSDLIVRMLRAGVKMGLLRGYLSTFIDDGGNRNLQAQARHESELFRSQAPNWVRSLRPVWVLKHRIRRLAHGQYRLKPFGYDVYTTASPLNRVHFEVQNPTFYWKSRM